MARGGRRERGPPGRCRGGLRRGTERSQLRRTEVTGPVSEPGRRRVLVAPRANLPATGGYLARLVEHTALRAGKRNLVGGVESAALGTFARAHASHDVVPAVLLDAHVQS